MMSVRVKAIMATIGRAKGDKLRKSLEKKFGALIRTRWKGKSLIIEGDALRDWRVREWIHGRLGAS